MPYATPTLAELISQAQNDIASANVTDDNGNVLDGFLEVGIVPVVAGMTLPDFAFGHYGYQAFIAKQAVPWTSDGEYWAGWASLKGVYQKPATATAGTVTFSGTGTTELPSGTSVIRSDGAKFTTSTSGSISGGTVTVSMTANVAGSAGNFSGGTTFYLASPITGITSQSTGSSQVTAGADAETFDAFKSRGLAVYANPPQGGDAQDYVEWATNVAGVTRAWVAPNAMGTGTVVVYVMLDVAEAAYGGFPQGTGGVATNETRDYPATGDQLTVANAIFPLQPVTALVYVEAPTADPINFTINNLGSNNTTAMQNLMTAALQDMFLRLANVGGSQNPQTRSPWNAIQPNDWYAALAAIPGLVVFSVSSPSASIPLGSTGALPVLGTVTFNT